MKLHVWEFAMDSQILDRLDENSVFSVDDNYFKLLDDRVLIVASSNISEITSCVIREDQVKFYLFGKTIIIKIEEIIKLDDLCKTMILRFSDNIYSSLDKNVALALLRKLQST